MSEVGSERHQYKHNGSVVYRWEEGLESMIVFVDCPPLPQSNIKKSNFFDISIKPHSLTIGIKGNPPYLKHEFIGVADTDESCWYIEETKKQNKAPPQIVIEIQKAQKAVRWGAVFKGHQSLDVQQQESLKKKLMLERFQEEHPGFDFSGASFNGQVPEARTFMGGMKPN